METRIAIEHTRLAELLEKARKALVVDTSPAVRSHLDEKLEKLAAELLLEWVVGEKRFESQSQQSEYWLSRFYEEVFVDEQPDATRIYERFGMSLPRAGYLSRLLRARRIAQWRHAARLELKMQLERKREDAEVAKAENTAHVQEFDVSLSSGAVDEMRVIYDRLSASFTERERPRPPKAKSRFGNARWFGLPAETLLLVLEDLHRGEAK